ncbi:protein of unknown function [Burkholderia multivorans]
MRAGRAQVRKWFGASPGQGGAPETTVAAHAARCTQVDWVSKGGLRAQANRTPISI